MTTSFNAKIVKMALKIVDQKKGPNNISVSPSNDFLYAHIFEKATGSPELWFRCVTKKSASFLRWDGSNFSEPAEIELNNIEASDIKYEYWYKNQVINTNGTLNFLTRYYLGYFQFFGVRETFLQKRYNQSTKFLNERQKILKEIVEASLSIAASEGNNNPFNTKKSALSWFFRMHGHRAANHPNYSMASLRFKAVLDSLEESGELGVQDNCYFGTGKAMTTLSNYELENRRHRNSYKLNLSIVALTIILAIAGSVQAWVGYANAHKTTQSP